MRGRSPFLYIAVLLLSSLFLATLSSAQAAPQAVILHETDETGVSYADNLHRFGWALLDDGAPVVHRNAHFEVNYNGIPLFATTPASGHDYDGIGRYWIAFPGPGEYQVNVEVPTDDGDATATFDGTVDDRKAGNATIDWAPPATAAQGEPTAIDYEVLDENGTPIDHAQIRFGVWNMERDTLVFQTDTHTHDAGAQPHALDYAFEEAGTHLLRVTAYNAHPTKTAEVFQAVIATHTIDVKPGEPRLPGVPTTEPLENRVDPGESDGPYRLFAGYDPYTSVGLGNPIRLTAVVADEDGQPVQHVDFTAKITGPDGETLFDTGSLHTYDGVLEITTSHQKTGDHRLVVQATRGEWSGTLESSYSVQAPAVTLTPGPHLVHVDGLEDMTAGEPGEVTVRVMSLTDQPFAHGEIEFQIREAETQRTLVAGKLHTHDDGLFPFTFTPPEPGDYRLIVDPYPLTPSPPTGFHGEAVGEDRVFRFSADGESDPFGLEDEGADEGADIVTTPGPAAAAGLLLMAVWVAHHRRRTR